MSQRRVVITGVGAITPLGASAAALWDGLLSGQSGIRPVTHFDASPFDVRFGGHCADFDPDKHLDKRAAKRMDRVVQLAVAAGKQAVAESGVSADKMDQTRFGVIVGTGIGGLSELEEQHLRLMQKGPSKVSAFTIPKLMANAAAGHLAIEFGAQGISTTVATACASAGNAMADALAAIRRGIAEVIITGGTEASLTPLGVAAFAAMKALSTRNDDPARACRPFDKDRDGFVLSEGAGILVFEELEHAKRRGAPILCEVLGAGATTDAGDMVAPDPEGRGSGRAIMLALRDAGVNPSDIDYINAHATSTPLGDVAETVAIKRVFGDHARKVAISSTKSATGHLLGASGGVETIACIRAIQHKVVPPTINLEQPDEQCDLDYTPKTPRDRNVRVALNNSFGFGGHNVALAFRSY